MPILLKAARKITTPFLATALAALFLTGCSLTPNNSALLLNEPAKISVVAAPKIKPLQTTTSFYGQTVEDEAIVEEEPLDDSVVEARDPSEAWNRKVHAFNSGFDKILVRPISKIYGTIVPLPVRLVVKNGLRHLEIPGDLINYTLQGNGRQVGKTLKRFVINSTLGLGGALDVASGVGVSYNPTDFGLTLATWGVGEGRYIVSPIFGPSTVRDGIGRIVDIGFRPQTYLGIITDFDYGGLVSRGIETVDRRHRNGDLLDNVIFASPDPYVTLRSTYLQRRRALSSDNVIGADGMEDALPVIATAGE